MQDYLKKLRAARTRWIIAIPGSLVAGFLFAASGVICIGVSGDLMGCGIGGMLIGMIIAITGALVCAIRIITLNHMINLAEKYHANTQTKLPSASITSLPDVSPQEHFKMNIPVAVALTIVLSFVLLEVVNRINGYTTWSIFFLEILASAAFSFGLIWLISRFKK